MDVDYEFKEDEEDNVDFLHIDLMDLYPILNSNKRYIEKLKNFRNSFHKISMFYLLPKESDSKRTLQLRIIQPILSKVIHKIEISDFTIHNKCLKKAFATLYLVKDIKFNFCDLHTSDLLPSATQIPYKTSTLSLINCRNPSHSLGCPKEFEDVFNFISRCGLRHSLGEIIVRDIDRDQNTSEEMVEKYGLENMSINMLAFGETSPRRQIKKKKSKCIIQ
ncbi:unnamed protein product [Moneuplotes crassus]|uniref:Uncharacterized protein n=1 Tax=Euplotes crassus TaxID=5936 RepID=A0AAD2CYM0_EUPCR|nr:unnamed protein product [Moneuplotes crassus]